MLTRAKNYINSPVISSKLMLLISIFLVFVVMSYPVERPVDINVIIAAIVPYVLIQIRFYLIIEKLYGYKHFYNLLFVIYYIILSAPIFMLEWRIEVYACLPLLISVRDFVGK